jgi:serine/threonine-protein kinase
MAKKPEGRPASAHNLAQAALALARGDTEEGLALIPLASDDAADGNQKSSANTGQTRNVSSSAGFTMGRKFWLFSGLGAAVAIALIATSLTVLLSTPSEEITEPPALPTAPEVILPIQPETEISAPDPDAVEPGIATVTITEAEIMGKTRTQVEELLAQKGLRLDAITGNTAPAQDRVQTAYLVNPQGTVATNTLIAVYFYAPIPQPPKPRDLIVTPAAGPWAPGTEILLEWPGYAQCPPGFALASYTLQVVGGEILDGNGGAKLLPEQTAVNIRLGSGQEFRASYLVNCQNLSSPLSNELRIPLTTPVEQPPTVD